MTLLGLKRCDIWMLVRVFWHILPYFSNLMSIQNGTILSVKLGKRTSKIFSKDVHLYVISRRIMDFYPSHILPLTFLTESLTRYFYNIIFIGYVYVS